MNKKTIILIISITIVLIICLTTIFFINHNKAKQNTDLTNTTEEIVNDDEPINNTKATNETIIDDEDNFINLDELIPQIKENLKNGNLDFENIRKNYSNENLILEVSKANENSGFSSIKEGEKYEESDYIYGSLSLENGIPKIALNGKTTNTAFTNIKEILMYDSGEYIHEFALFSNDGTLYIGNSLRDLYDGGNDEDSIKWKIVEAEKFNTAKKVENNKFTEIYFLDIGWISDDTESIALIGKTTEGTYELFVVIE